MPDESPYTLRSECIQVRDKETQAFCYVRTQRMDDAVAIYVTSRDDGLLNHLLATIEFHDGEPKLTSYGD